MYMTGVNLLFCPCAELSKPTLESTTPQDSYSPKFTHKEAHMTVYLLHFLQPYHHARHYLGSTDDIDSRLQEHRTGQGARLTQVIHEAGISFILARTWEGGRDLERKLKRWHKSPDLCPICKAQKQEH